MGCAVSSVKAEPAAIPVLPPAEQTADESIRKTSPEKYVAVDSIAAFPGSRRNSQPMSQQGPSLAAFKSTNELIMKKLEHELVARSGVGSDAGGSRPDTSGSGAGVAGDRSQRSYRLSGKSARRLSRPEARASNNGPAGGEGGSVRGAGVAGGAVSRMAPVSGAVGSGGHVPSNLALMNQ